MDGKRGWNKDVVRREEKRREAEREGKFEHYRKPYLTESMTNTTSSIVILVSAMFVERIIWK